MTYISFDQYITVYVTAYSNRRQYATNSHDLILKQFPKVSPVSYLSGHHIYVPQLALFTKLCEPEVEFRDVATKDL